MVTKAEHPETGPVPEANRPGHHPEHEQDKPVEAFVERAQAKVREAETAPLRKRAAAIIAEVEDKERPHAQVAPRRGIPIEAVIPALAFVDAALKPASAWAEVGARKSAWLAGIVLMPGIGAWRYAADLMPRLKAAERALALLGA